MAQAGSEGITIEKYYRTLMQLSTRQEKLQKNFLDFHLKIGIIFFKNDELLWNWKIELLS